MPGLVIAEIDKGRDRLARQLDEGREAIRLEEGDSLDAAGAQLIAAAVIAGRNRGMAMRVELPGPATALWRRLALDSLCEPSGIAPTGDA
ncbi:MAG: hypothetical protein KDK24_07460 [Pseudooceanicola sp.]|nr:hypothetical protein [Pseudooceanicola sp.]